MGKKDSSLYKKVVSILSYCLPCGLRLLSFTLSKFCYYLIVFYNISNYYMQYSFLAISYMHSSTIILILFSYFKIQEEKERSDDNLILSAKLVAIFVFPCQSSSNLIIKNFLSKKILLFVILLDLF